MKIWKNAVLFYLGGCGYLGIELLYRGRTDSSMFVAGGLCFLLVGMLNRAWPRVPRLIRAMMGALAITGVELGVGLAVNRDYRVWDYRGQPGNFLGQICPLFTLLWIPLALAAGFLYDWLDEKIGAAAAAPKDQFSA